MKTYKAAPDVHVITSSFPIPGFGQLAVNAFVIKGSEPVLVDTGSVIESDQFMQTLKSVIDPSELRWIWLTHTDFDHMGSLSRLLTENPQIRVITSFLGAGIMNLAAPIPIDRIYAINPGQKIKVGDRTLVAVRPPVFDNPSTLGLLDEVSGAFFSSDCFGGLLPEVPEDATLVPEQVLREGQGLWAIIESPWLHKVDRSNLMDELDKLRVMAPSMILSSHLPAAPRELTEQMLETIALAPLAHPFVAPDQMAIEQMLAQMASGKMKMAA